MAKSDQKAEAKCDEKVEIFSRVVGYYRPVTRWNDGKKEEFVERNTFCQDKALGSDFSGIQEKAS